MNYLFLSAAFAVLFSFNIAQACDSHLIPVTPTVLDGDRNSSVQLNGQYSDYDPPSSGGHDFENLTTTLTISQQVGDRWSVQAGLPYIDRTLDDESESGIGDATLIGVFRLWEQQQESSAVLVDVYTGIEAPTGDTDPLEEEKEAADDHGDDQGEDHAEDHHAHGHHLALGSGSWDGIFGAIVQARRDVWSVSLDVQYILRTEGDYDFEYGDEYYARSGVYRRFDAGTAGSYLAGVVASGEWADENSVAGVTQEGSSKSAGYLGPVISYTAGAAITASLAYDFPVYNTDEGLDGAADARLRASMSYLF
jgi:hypothetical protein